MCAELLTRDAILTFGRTYRFAVLGMSLSSMFEVKDTFDLLRGLLNILSEYEQIKDDPIDKSKIVCSIFRRAGFLIRSPSAPLADIPN